MAEDVRRRMRRQATSLALAVGPFGIAFGVICAEAGLSVAESVGFSSLVFTGGTQFAAVGVLNDGGTAVAAVSAGLLLSFRSLAFGVVMAPALRGSFVARAAMSQLMIDEAMAVGSSTDDLDDRRYGYLWGGLAVFVVWNLTTVAGRLLVDAESDVVSDYGLDATIPAAFLALLWPRLERPDQRRTAFVGAAIALVLVPLTPPGVPVIAAALAVLAARPGR
jgi:predicted branched-subunit amino acid permease